MFLAPWFAIAGLIAATGPILIHLLNRRRYRVVEWAAMDFLREAIFRSRRIMQLRDLLLLALRTLCIAGFGAAMALPFLGTTVGMVDPDQPVHAVLLVDNSLSMGYREFDKTLLDEAKEKAKELIGGYPRGSRISVLPTCGSAAGFSYTAYYSKEDAREALDRIEPVDRSAMAGETIDLALEACRRLPAMANKEIVLLSDQQVSNWPTQSRLEHLKQLPGPIKVVELKPGEVDNAWVSDFKLRDGVADLQTPTVFVATLEYEGSFSRRDVQVTLTVEGETIAARTVDLQPGQKREVEFAPYQFDVPTEPGKPAFATAEVSIPQDKLPADDQRSLVVPVVATLPVVFVDQWGQDEDPRHNRYGETFSLRRLLAPVTSRSQRDRQLVEVRHVRIDELGRSLLEDARLVAIAGVSSPQTAVALLREYVEQGGNLLIAAGGNFDPALWNDVGWQEGLGILPAPLSPVTVGRLPDESPGRPEWFQLDYNSLKNHDYFLVEGTAGEELEDLYRLPYFFKAVDADVSDEVKDAMVRAAVEQIRQRAESLAQIDKQLAEFGELETRLKLSADERRRQAELQAQRAQFKPNWLLWADPARSEDDGRPAEELAAETKFSVLARYTNGLPFMVERRIGRGKVLLVSTGIYPEWNTLAVTNTVLVYDRILRVMLQETLPERNMSSERQLVLPVAAAERSASITLTGPDGREEPLSIDAVGADRYGITVGNLTKRGLYYVTAARGKDSPREGLQSKLWEIPLAINGPSEESQLVSSEEAELRHKRGQTDSLESAQAYAIGGFQRAQLRGAGLWKWVMVAVLVCLLLELVFLAWLSRRGERIA